MIDIEDFQRIKKLESELRSKQDKALGRLEELKKTLLDFDCKTTKEAKVLHEKLAKEIEELEQEVEKEYEEFKNEFSDQLDQIS